MAELAAQRGLVWGFGKGAADGKGKGKKKGKKCVVLCFVCVWYICRGIDWTDGRTD